MAVQVRALVDCSTPEPGRAGRGWLTTQVAFKATGLDETDMAQNAQWLGVRSGVQKMWIWIPVVPALGSPSRSLPLSACTPSSVTWGGHQTDHISPMWRLNAGT